ncbi:MAG TPA: hypothetical protein VKE93_11660 [Candidatus Angelobacter sp.]|nr:hypothetical protein [Candidatus Angelobacter sp.]
MNSEHQLDSLLKQMAEAHRPELPSPDLIWWRAQILRKQEQRKRIERPLMVMRLGAIVACLAIGLGLFAANQQMFREALGGIGWILPVGIAVVVVFLVSTIALFRFPAKG